jgi:hypothetical protein
MKLIELIAELQSIAIEEGDVEVRIFLPDIAADLKSINYDGKNVIIEGE